jgi:hypothetical protein
MVGAMVAESTEVGRTVARSTAAASGVVRSRHGMRARVTVDKRFVIGKRVKQLVDVFRARIGPDADDPVTAAAIARAAETTVLAEHLRAQMLRGAPISADDVLRASRTADLLTRRLHLDRHRKAAEAPTLSSYLASRSPEQRTGELPAAGAAPSDEGVP